MVTIEERVSPRWRVLVQADENHQRKALTPEEERAEAVRLVKVLGSVTAAAEAHQVSTRRIYQLPGDEKQPAKVPATGRSIARQLRRFADDSSNLSSDEVKGLLEAATTLVKALRARQRSPEQVRHPVRERGRDGVTPGQR